MLTDVVLEPGDSASYGFTWNHVDDSGNQVPAPHHFLVRGMILSWEAVGPADTIIRIRKPLGPVAALTWETCVLCLAPGSSVFFNASWSAPRKAIMEYLWDFGDGNEPVKTTEPSISHVFFTTDRSLVSLTVTSLNGLTDTLSLPVVFLLIPRFTYTPFHPRVFQPVLFDGSDSISYRNGIDEFRWDFGDGTVATDKIVSHSCSRPGIYGITLTILSGTELSSTSETIFVRMSGDVNLDCTVNILDLVTVAGLFMKTSNQADYDPAADVNSDGIVNLLDIVSVATEFNSACEAPTM